MKIVHEAGPFKVLEFHRAACGPCVKGWADGTIAHPRDSGIACTHGPGLWQAGTVGPRGGWHGVGPRYTSLPAAQLLCNALDNATYLNRQG